MSNEAPFYKYGAVDFRYTKTIDGVVFSYQIAPNGIIVQEHQTKNVYFFKTLGEMDFYFTDHRKLQI